MIDMRIVATGLRFPEGPVAMSDGSVILGEIAGGCVTRIAPTGSRNSVAATGGGPNGLAIGPDKALYVCNNGGNEYRPEHFMAVGPARDYSGGSIQRVDLKSGQVKTLYTACGENRLSSPNDIVFDEHGGFYFTDMGKRHHRHRANGGVYYAKPDGSMISEVAYPVIGANGIGLSPDNKTLYVAETETSRLWEFAILGPGLLKKEVFPLSPHGGRLTCGLAGYQQFDSLAVDAFGNICVATLMTGHISVIQPDGALLRQVKLPSVFPTNICFGGKDMRTAYITLSDVGQMVAMKWPEPGLRLNWSALM